MDKLLTERDPITKYLFSRSTQEFVAQYGEDIWDKMNTKYVLEFEIDLSNNFETLLFGFTPKIRVKFEAWKSEDDIHIKIIPQFIINKKSNEITFSGPFNILQKIKSVVLNYPGVDFELNFGVFGAIEFNRGRNPMFSSN